MVWRGTSLVIPVLALLCFGSRISCSLTTVKSSQNAGKQENTEDTEFQVKRHVRRGVGDELNALKDKAKKANSFYKWLKENWKKIFVIIVAIFALIVVVGIYRKCFSDSGSSGDDEEPTIVVVRMLKPDSKGNGKCLDPIVAEGITEGGGGGDKRKNADRHNAGKKDISNTRTTEEVITGGKTKKTLITTNLLHQEVKRPTFGSPGTVLPAVTSKGHLQESRFLDLHINGIPISGYTAFQQTEFCMVYFDLLQYFLKVTKTDQPRTLPTRICQGSTSKGPFPFYEETPLIKILIAALGEKYCDNYFPTAITNTNLPLTVSP